MSFYHVNYYRKMGPVHLFHLGIRNASKHPAQIRTTNPGDFRGGQKEISFPRTAKSHCWSLSILQWSQSKATYKKLYNNTEKQLMTGTRRRRRNATGIHLPTFGMLVRSFSQLHIQQKSGQTLASRSGWRNTSRNGTQP